MKLVGYSWTSLYQIPKFWKSSHIWLHLVQAAWRSNVTDAFLKLLLKLGFRLPGLSKFYVMRFNCALFDRRAVSAVKAKTARFHLRTEVRSDWVNWSWIFGFSLQLHSCCWVLSYWSHLALFINVEIFHLTELHSVNLIICLSIRNRAKLPKHEIC